MPDTAIFAALSGIVEEGESVDTQGFKDWLVRIEGKIDSHHSEMNAVDKRVVKVEADLNGLGQRIDSTRVEIRDVQAEAKKQAEDSSGPGKAGWAGILIAAITAAGAACVAYFTRGKA